MLWTHNNKICFANAMMSCDEATLKLEGLNVSTLFSVKLNFEVWNVHQ